MRSEDLINQLIKETQEIISEAEQLKKLDTKVLTWKENSTSWSILECLEHLNLYGEYYLPQIESRINKSTTKTHATFKSGILGSYFAKSMLPQEKLNKMRTANDKNPSNCTLNGSVIDNFIQQQKRLLYLLNQSRTVSLSNIKITPSISRFIRLKLGDTFQFINNHTIRHFVQIERIKIAMKNATQ